MTLRPLALAAYQASLDQEEHAARDYARAIEAIEAALAFLETAAFIGLLVPGEMAIVVGGVAAADGEVELVAMIAAPSSPVRRACRCGASCRSAPSAVSAGPRC